MARANIDTDEIMALMDGIFDSVFSTALEHLADEMPNNHGSITGCIQISGAWEGAVVLSCSRALAVELTATMLELDQPADEDVLDALGEVTNLASGAIQALLPAPTELTPPSVVEGHDYKLVLPKHKVLQEAHFACHGQPLSVRLFEVTMGEACVEDPLTQQVDGKCLS